MSEQLASNWSTYGVPTGVGNCRPLRQWLQFRKVKEGDRTYSIPWRQLRTHVRFDAEGEELARDATIQSSFFDIESLAGIHSRSLSRDGHF